ncbi:nitric oxide-associated protein 1 [Chrysoperla carnea]|uniref:nitric oxide-associated protein 1 n=1 Tax=Chrysoperla carnea TaxID=189513 RepID=UPI001D064DA3|nr:nitric oxide-associated protein 1 [Chrysoperla carnea]
MYHISKHLIRMHKQKFPKSFNKIFTCVKLQSNTKLEEKYLQQIKISTELDKLLDKVENKISYNTIIDRKKFSHSYRKHKIIENILSKQENELTFQLKHLTPLPASLKYYMDNNDSKLKEEVVNNKEIPEPNVTKFPYDLKQSTTNFEITSNDLKVEKDEISEQSDEHIEKVPANWMSDYELYSEELDTGETDSWKMNYGTPNPNLAVSQVPCGGCGSLLHCKDTSIPGYIPSEIFENVSKKELASIICQRCHFLKNYNTTLQVRISPDEYPKILSTIKSKYALVILMVDLLDFPCSIWPNIIDIIGSKRPVIVVGNKVDLLPQDSRGYLNHIKFVLEKVINETGISKANIKHTALISAKTGYGIEELITKLHSIWEYKGDVYLVGCTNVGKSSLFNALLQSDYCKIQAVDLIQRATVSQWPGTTLNLLKFPILRPSGWRLYARTKRLVANRNNLNAENALRKSRLRETKNPMYASLIGHIDRTFTPEEPIDLNTDPFTVGMNPNAGTGLKTLNEKSEEYVKSKWCFDTPGVLQPDQFLHLLTTEEIMLTLPKQIIAPQTFSLKPKQTIFIAGLARLDVIESSCSSLPLRFTIFTSNSLPITICDTKDADDLYKQLIGSELFLVPQATGDRLMKWTSLTSGEILNVVGKDYKISSADIILSSAGWIAITPGPDVQCKLQAWTPEGRGIHVREPSLLPYAVNLRGKKIRGSPAYGSSKFFIRE